MPQPPPLKSVQFARVALTGRFARDRDELVGRIEANRGVIVKTVSRRTSILAIGSLGWPMRRDGKPNAALRRAEELNARGGRVRIMSEAALARLVGVDDTPSRCGPFTEEQALDAVDLDGPTLTRWRQLGLIDPGDGLDFQDLVSLRTLADLVGAGAHPETIGATLHGLAQHVSGIERPLAQLKLLALSASDLVAEVRGAVIDPSGQLRLFGVPDALETEPIEADLAGNDTDALDRAEHCESEARFEEAAAWYRAALERDGADPEIWFNLGNAERQAGEANAAAHAFERATALDPTFAEAWYNLADVLEDADPGRAIGALRRAVGVRPSFADALFNLASLLDSTGDTDGAEPYWRRYLALDSRSEWADAARDRLELSER